MIDPRDIVQFPGEPDILAEVRLRAELKALRTVATQHEYLERMRGIFLQAWPGTFEAQEILSPTMREYMEIRGPFTKWIKKRLLGIEAHFVEKGWKLPKWRRPDWLLEAKD